MCRRSCYGLQTTILFPSHWSSRGEVLPAAANANFHGIVLKNPFTMSKTVTCGHMPKDRYHRRIKCGGKLVAYILEDRLESGGAYRDRTDDLMLAKQPLSQLS